MMMMISAKKVVDIGEFGAWFRDVILRISYKSQAYS